MLQDYLRKHIEKIIDAKTSDISFLNGSSL